LTALPAPAWSFHEGDAHRIQALLRSLLRDAGALDALLIDRAGQLLVRAGDDSALDVVAFASLAAADFAANDQLAAMLGEREFSSLSHQGERESIFLADVARRAILVVRFDRGSTLGMVRIKTRQAVRELSEVFREMSERRVQPTAATLDAGWADEAADQIDRLFGAQ
jgi:predicted regulator of Ras-like GTPase activity (Roadblock/LC7/MglB family)